jgi:hypothetical protein
MPSRRAQAAAADLRPLRPCFAPSCSLLSLSVLPASFLPVLRERATCAPFERAGPRSTHMHMLFYIHVAIDPARPQSTRTRYPTPHTSHTMTTSHIYIIRARGVTHGVHTHTMAASNVRTHVASLLHHRTHIAHITTPTHHTRPSRTRPRRVPRPRASSRRPVTHTHMSTCTHTPRTARARFIARGVRHSVHTHTHTLDTPSCSRV